MHAVNLILLAQNVEIRTSLIRSSSVQRFTSHNCIIYLAS